MINEQGHSKESIKEMEELYINELDFAMKNITERSMYYSHFES